MKTILIIFPLFLLIGCSTSPNPIYLGGDLSYVNEMLDCGGVFRLNGEIKNPYEIFAEKGANIVRVRLWHNPEWTNYSNFQDVKKTIRLSKEQGMSILLDFHYSDNWADPGDQIIPKAWADIKDIETLGDSLYNYTFETLDNLAKANLLPEFVQIGNETNSEILLQIKVDELTAPINWTRNIFLFNKGLQALEDISQKYKKEVRSMIHIAQPEFAFPWFDTAMVNGLNDFEWIGLSYYPKWSSYPLSSIDKTVDSLIRRFNKRVMVIETAYPYSLESHDEANNILMEDALIENYPASPKGQLKFMEDLTKAVINGGGEGVIYWEPAWISTQCTTRWGKGSHWENATFFDAGNGNEALEVFDFLNYDSKK